MFVLPYERSIGLPYLCTENLCIVILYYTTGIRGDSLPRASLPLDQQFVQIAVLHCSAVEGAFPIAATSRMQPIFFVFCPIVEFAQNIPIASRFGVVRSIDTRWQSRRAIARRQSVFAVFAIYSYVFVLLPIGTELAMYRAL